MNILVTTSPLVQLNSPYPSGAYLNSFFKKLGHNSHWDDLSIKLFYEIFSREGLKKLFALSEKNALKLAEKADKNGNEFEAFNLRRYIAQKDYWINWIDWITAILCDSSKFSGREKAHQFLYSPFVPRGNRMEAFLETLDHTPTVDDVRFLCSFALADLSDYITYAFDKNFSLIRYAESLTVDERNFSQIEKELDSPILDNFYKPLLERLYKNGDYNLVCISVPFAGTFIPGLYTARFFKEHFPQTFVILGGGFVNTELRNAKDKSLSKYVNAISYDRGYGSYRQFTIHNSQFAIECGEKNDCQESKSFDKSKQIYKMRIFADGKVIEPLWEDKEAENFENQMTSEVMPDYSDIDFSIYPRVCDDENPMHRLWTDGGWIKAYLAHGCYWHKCAFCDTQLDYVCAYRPVEAENLYNTLLKTAEEKGVYGIHFVDEALPPKMLNQFALLNAHKGNPLYYWGNVRFEKAFTKDTAAFLSYGGLGGVSAGLEVATGEGLKHINKGTDIDSVVSACAAFKEAGILVHAYMIYGFWYDTPQTIIDSMETLRQFFEAGLLDSAFWHKFMLTKNSTVYAEWEKGLHPELKPIEPKTAEGESTMFAQNNIHFAGEEKYEKFGNGLENALNSWMHGEKLDMKVQKWFDFQVPFPNVPKDYIEKAIEKYEHRNDSVIVNQQNLNNVYWLGGNVLERGNKISWNYLQNEEDWEIRNSEFGMRNLSSVLEGLRPESSVEVRERAINLLKNDNSLLKEVSKLHGKGIVVI